MGKYNFFLPDDVSEGFFDKMDSLKRSGIQKQTGHAAVASWVADMSDSDFWELVQTYIREGRHDNH